LCLFQKSGQLDLQASNEVDQNPAATAG